MTNLLTRTGARWWFRSRNSGSLNLFSYWLCALILSAFAALIADALYQTLADRQAWHRQAAEYSDWIYAAPPDALKAYTKRFEKKRNELIRQVVRGDDESDWDKDTLVPAGEVKTSGRRCRERGGMFGKRDTPIYPSCVTYASRTKRGRLTRDETTVFNNFAAYITGLYTNNKGEEPNRIEHELEELS